uniref:MAM domain-containing protein n=1 Tax=Paramormyrops kingsleyae TaxID=1676925 RepID=A0A3B3RPL2_9TELE
MVTPTFIGDQDVALDDMQLLDCSERDVPAGSSRLSCSFEADACAWYNDQGSLASWERVIGKDPWSQQLRPDHDHTSGTGYYLSAQIWRWSVGDVGRVLTRLHDPTPKSGECLKFWYHMDGEGVGTLSIYLQKLDRSRVLLWSEHGNQGDLWRQGRTTVLSHDAPYQVVFEAVTGDGVGMDIAIDDLLILNGPCPPQGFCDFESDPCSWLSVRPLVSGMDWDWTSASSTAGGRGPPVDHTTNSGHYMYYSKSMLTSPTTTNLQSEYLDPTTMGCLVFWYHLSVLYHGKQGRKFTLNMYQQSEDGGRKLVFSKTGSQGELWRLGNIVVEGVWGTGVSGGVAIDDVVLSNGACPPPGVCDFQGSLCGWTNIEAGDQADWLRGRGTSPLPSTGPRVDHTMGSSQGYYVYVDSAVGQKGDKAMLYSEVFQPTQGDGCLSFWYHRHVLGPHSTLEKPRNPFGDDEKDLALLWTEAGSQGDTWIEATVAVSNMEPFWVNEHTCSKASLQPPVYNVKSYLLCHSWNRPIWYVASSISLRYLQ